MALTPKQRLFVENYLQCWNGVRSARLAGYKGNETTLAAIAYENLRKPHIREQINKRLDDEAMAANEVLARLAAVARADMGDLVEALMEPTAHGVVMKARDLGLSFLLSKVRPTRHGVAVELHSMIKALELLGRRYKLFTDKLEHGGGVEFAGTWTVEPDPGPEPGGGEGV